jgi:hypothetical protein
MNKQEQKEIIRRLRRKYRDSYTQKNSPVITYLPNSVKAEVDQHCKEKGIAKAAWVCSVIIKEVENNLKKRYDYTRREFVEIEGKAKKKVT